MCFVDSYSEARIYEKKAQETSNLSSEDEEAVKKTSKRIRQPNQLYEYDTVSDSESSPPKKNKKRKTPPQAPKLKSFSPESLNCTTARISSNSPQTPHQNLHIIDKRPLSTSDDYRLTSCSPLIAPPLCLPSSSIVQQSFNQHLDHSPLPLPQYQSTKQSLISHDHSPQPPSQTSFLMHSTSAQPNAFLHSNSALNIRPLNILPAPTSSACQNVECVQFGNGKLEYQFTVLGPVFGQMISDSAGLTSAVPV